MTAMTPESVAVAELQAVGVQPSTADVEVVEAWEAAEGGHWHNHAWFNPENTTPKLPGSTPIDGNASQNNGHPVQAYTSWAQGIQAFAETLVGTKNSQGQPVYDPILQALADNDAAAAAQAIVNSPWGTKKITVGGKTYTRGGTTAAATGGAASQTSGAAAQNAGLLGAHGWNPLNWPGQILDAGVSGVWDQVQPFLVTAMFTVGAIAIFVIGAKQLVEPAVAKAADAAGAFGVPEV